MKKGKADFAMNVLIQTGKSLRKSREYSLHHGKKKRIGWAESHRRVCEAQNSMIF